MHHLSQLRGCPVSHIWFTLHPAQAPAQRLGVVARACIADGSQNDAMHAASKCNPKNSERDAHALFRRYWLSLRVPISDVEVPPQDGGLHTSIPCYKVTVC